MFPHTEKRNEKRKLSEEVGGGCDKACNKDCWRVLWDVPAPFVRLPAPQWLPPAESTLAKKSFLSGQKYDIFFAKKLHGASILGKNEPFLKIY